MNQEFTFSELNDVVIKPLFPTQLNGVNFAPGEPIAILDKVSISILQMPVVRKSAQGGKDNKTQITWESTADIPMALVQGVFSKNHFAIMMGAKAYTLTDEEALSYDFRQFNTDENGVFALTKAPVGDFFVYNSRGEKIAATKIGERNIKVDSPNSTVNAYYQFNAPSGWSKVEMGTRVNNLGFMSLEGKTKIKHDVTGEEQIGIIRFPKVQLMSNLSMRLGEKANPTVATFEVLAIAEKGVVMEFSFLSKED